MATLSSLLGNQFKGDPGPTGPQGPIGIQGEPGPTIYPASGIAVSTGTAWGTSKAAPTGTIVGTSDSQTLTNKTIQDGVYSNKVDVTGYTVSSRYDLPSGVIPSATSNYFTLTSFDGQVVNFPSAPADRVYAFILELAYTGGLLIWNGTVKWSGGLAPTLTAGKTHLIVFITDDGGVTWRGTATVDYDN